MYHEIPTWPPRQDNIGTLPWWEKTDHPFTPCPTPHDEAAKHWQEILDRVGQRDVEPLTINTQPRKQVGGSHYDMEIEPIDFIMKNKLDFNQGNIVKYICRFRQKNGAEDLRKVIDYAKIILEKEYGETV